MKICLKSLNKVIIVFLVFLCLWFTVESIKHVKYLRALNNPEFLEKWENDNNF